MLPERIFERHANRLKDIAANRAITIGSLSLPNIRSDIESWEKKVQLLVAREYLVEALRIVSERPQRMTVIEGILQTRSELKKMSFVLADVETIRDMISDTFLDRSVVEVILTDESLQIAMKEYGAYNSPQEMRDEIQKFDIWISTSLVTAADSIEEENKD